VRAEPEQLRDALDRSRLIENDAAPDVVGEPLFEIGQSGSTRSGCRAIGS
jgi:hypothetical protein